MKSFQTTFLEIDYETTEAARAARDEQAVQLEAQGVSCRRETLYRATDGRCVFVITMNETDTEDVKEAIAAPSAKRVGEASRNENRPSGTRRDRTRKPRKPRTNSHEVEYR